MPDTDPINWTDLDKARLMALDYYPASAEGIRCCEALARRLTAADKDRKYARGVWQRHKFEGAVAAFIADLLKGAERDSGRWSFRSLDTNSFIDCHVPYRQFDAVRKGMEALGWIDRKPGYFERYGFGPRTGTGKATRFRAEAPLFALVNEFGITPENVDKHFHQRLPKKPLVLRAPSVRVKNEKRRGKELRIEDTPETQRLTKEVQDLNSFLQRFRLVGGTHRGYRRIFNQGTEEGYRWNKGGRLYSIGEDAYQRSKKEQRLAMLLDDNPVVEIDIRASYLTILHALKGLPFNPQNDPYDIPDLPRDVVKTWVTMTLGHTDFHKRYPSETLKDFREKGIDLSERYPLRKIGPVILEHLPVMKDWPEDKVTCFDLMYLESEAMIRTMLELMREWEKPSLSVHDSIIVRSHDENMATNVLKKHYKVACGVEPFLVSSS